MRYEITEVCANCENEVTMLWNTDADGFKAFCPFCGEELMLCDECQHAEDCTECDWCKERGCWRKRQFEEKNLEKRLATTKYDIKEVLEMTFDMCEDYYDDIHKSTLTWILNGGNLPLGQDIIKWCADMCGIDVNDICGSLTETDVYRIVYNYLRINAFEITYVEELGKLIAFWSIECNDGMEEEFVGFVYGNDLEDRKLFEEKIEEFLDKKMLEIKNGD